MAALPPVELDPPTISMTFGVNDSPLAGRDGTHVSLIFSSIVIFQFDKCSLLSFVLVFLKFFTLDGDDLYSQLCLNKAL